MTAFAKRGTGVAVRLPAAQRTALKSLVGQLIELLEPFGNDAGDNPSRGTDPAGAAHDAGDLELGIGGSASAPTDAAIARLLPNAYPDEESSAEFRRLTETALVERKIAAARACADSLSTPRAVLDPGAVTAWLRTLTDLRLILASRLGIEFDGDHGSGDPALTAVYDWLGYLQGTLLEVLE